MSLILNIETSTSICSVSLSREGSTLDFLELKEANAHAAQLAPMVDQLLQRNGVVYSQLNAIALSQGPGSYTGLRIGSSLAKGLCYSLQIPMIAIDTLQSIAYQALQLQSPDFEGWIQPMVDARRMEVYTQSFDAQLKAQNPVEAVVLTPNIYDEILQSHHLIFCGDGAPKYATLLEHPHAHFLTQVEASARGMSALSFQKFQEKQFVDLAYFEPFYLKEFAAAVSKIKGLN
jgi:tRNA threonylcarbamoyladenosine biosynthesis protein TsaB